MARRVFFSFHYDHVWKVNQIRSMPNITGTAAAGFQDASVWEAVKNTKPARIYRMIDQALKNTSVTVVCITFGCTGRKYINYEIDRSLEKGNGLVAIQIHHLKNQKGNTGSAGAIPPQIESNGFKVYKYTNKEALAKWIEEAANIALGKKVAGRLRKTFLTGL